MLNPSNHYLGRLHERGGRLPLAQLHLTHGISSDDGGDPLVAYGKHNFGKQAADLYFDNRTDELISSAQSPEPLT